MFSQKDTSGRVVSMSPSVVAFGGLRGGGGLAADARGCEAAQRRGAAAAPGDAPNTSGAVRGTENQGTSRSDW